MLAAILAAAGFSFSACAGSCADAPFRMAESFKANILQGDGGGAAHFAAARGDRFKPYLKAHLWMVVLISAGEGLLQGFRILRWHVGLG